MAQALAGPAAAAAGLSSNNASFSSDHADPKPETWRRNRVSAVFHSLLLFILDILQKIANTLTFGRKEQNYPVHPTNSISSPTSAASASAADSAAAAAATTAAAAAAAAAAPPAAATRGTMARTAGSFRPAAHRKSAMHHPPLSDLASGQKAAPKTTPKATPNLPRASTLNEVVTTMESKTLNQLAANVANLDLNEKTLAKSTRDEKESCQPAGNTSKASTASLRGSVPANSENVRPGNGDGEADSGDALLQHADAKADSTSAALPESVPDTGDDLPKDAKYTTAVPDATNETALVAKQQPSTTGEQVQIRARVPILNVGAKYSPEERAIHQGFIDEALEMARLALRTNETPVGCVIVYNGRIIAKGMNATNHTRNGTRHAELMAICALLSHAPESEAKTAKSSGSTNDAADEDAVWGDVDPSDGHVYPYGQKLHPAPRVDKNIIQESTLYVTVEPCVMCASLLRQLRIKKVFFGAVNDKFGGTGGVFRIHQNAPARRTAGPASNGLGQNGKPSMSGPSKPLLPRATNGNGKVVEDGEATGDCAPAPAAPPAPSLALEGDGGQVEPGYEVEGGWGRDEAVTLLRQFYVQENGRAPIPRKKEGRAARLAAMMERDGHAGGPMIPATENDTAVPAGEPNNAQDMQSVSSSDAAGDKEEKNEHASVQSASS